MSSFIQGHHLIPQGLLKNPTFSTLFGTFLPGWDLNGTYNFDARPTSMEGSAQLNSTRHSGGHKSLDDAVERVLNQIDGLPASQKPLALAQLVTFMEEANNLDNLDPGGKTGAAKCLFRVS